jgi:hypothetical protein
MYATPSHPVSLITPPAAGYKRIFVFICLYVSPSLPWSTHIAAANFNVFTHLPRNYVYRSLSTLVDSSLYTFHNIIIFNLRTAAFKPYCAIWVRRSNFRHPASPRVSPRESYQRKEVELRARNVWEFCLNTEFHVTFRDLLHAVKLRHGTDGFTSPPKEGMPRIFSP